MIAKLTRYYILLVSFGWFTQNALAQKDGAFSKIETLPEKFQSLPFGEIKPEGWLKEQVEQNLNGFTGHLDSLAPSLIVEDEIYGKDRLSNKIKHKDVGAVGDAGDWQVQFLWWNSESQSNWWDGYIRSAILTGNQQDLQKIRQHIKYILSTQDADGYLGIYDQDLRYKFDNENGELWAKTTLLPDVGGLSHGLAFTDVLENLYRITKKHSYLDYALFCYKDFSNQKLNEDALLEKLLDTSLLLKGHGVHTYEHLRSVASAYYASGNPKLKLALNNFLYKIKLTTSASGGPVGDEWIGGKKADATSRGYEYCSLQELMNSYTDLFTKSGESNYADKAERLFFNAAQGSRDPQESCIAYLKSDNSYYMTGGLNGDTTAKNQTRYTYSPVHQEAAVCCVPNAGRIAPYYIQNMWVKDGNNMVATLLGPCIVNTILNEKKISIKEKTNYPYSFTIDFEISADNATFGLRIRKPSWVKKFSVSEGYNEEDGFIIINKKWNGKEIIKIQFSPEIKVEQDINKENYFTYGALVLAHPIESIADTTKTFSVPGFYNLKYRPQNLVIYNYSKNNVIQTDKEKLFFKTSLFNPVTKQEEEVTLKPMGPTILRQVTFKER